MASPVIQASAITIVGNSASWVVSTPSGIVDGNLLIALLWSNVPARAFNTPAGWSAGPAFAGTGFRMSVFTRSGTSSEPASYTFANSVGAVGGHATMHRVTSASLLSPINASTYTELAQSSASPWLASSISPTSKTATLFVDVSYVAVGTGQTFTPPGSMSQVYNFNTGTSEKAAGFTEVLSASGATGTRSITVSATTTSSVIGMTSLAITPQASMITTGFRLHRLRHTGV
jgi:hypothetical protein